MRINLVRRQPSGFTIIELLVVIGIIGILAAVILSGTASARGKGRQSAALQTMKSIHDAAMICVSTNPATATLCYPGGNTGGCSATAIGDTQNGGGGPLCTNNSSARYSMLPAGYVYCNGTATVQSQTDCGDDTSGPTSGSFRIRAENAIDGILITCDETGCNATTDSN